MPHSQLIFAADIGDIVTAIIALLVPLLYVLKQIFEDKGGRPQPRQAEQPPAAPQPPAQKPVQAGNQQADPLRSQVEEFLRRAGRAPQQGEGRRAAGGQRGPRPARASDIEVLVDEDARELPERRPLAQPLRPASPPLSPAAQQPQRTIAARKARTARPLAGAPGAAGEIRADHLAPVTDSVAAHSRMIGEQTSRLGQRIIEEDEQFDVELKARFDHTVGTLTGSAITAAEQAAAAVTASQTPAAQIAKMLSSPDGVRQAIVVNEILRRPGERW